MTPLILAFAAAAGLAWCQSATPEADAVVRFRAELERDPRSADAAYNLGLALLKAHHPAEALAVLDRHPHAIADHQALRGAVLNALGRWKEAAQALRRAITVDPNNPDWLYDLVLVLLKSEANTEASQVAARGRRRFPRVAKIRAASGMVAYLNGRNAEAVAEYEAAARIEPAADLYAALGDVHDATGDLAKAEAAYAQAVRLDPRGADYWLKYGRNLVKFQRPGEARSAFARCLALDPENADAHFQAGKLEIESDLAAAISHFERAVEANRSLKEAWYQLGIAYRKAGREADSLRALERVRALP